MVSQISLIESFKDTQIMIKSNEVLKRETKKMQAGTRLYLDHFVSVIKNRKCEMPSILVVEDTTFSCARKWTFAGEKTAVLNFANAYNPGGGVKNGATAQEESLCRSSNLYESLTLPYIVRHYYKWNQKHTGDMGTDSVVYAPGVTVFKSDDACPAILESDDWFRVDVITCAAPYYDIENKKPVTQEKLEQVFRERITNILEAAIANDVDYLILGAFGCGAFHNPPELVASVFRELLIADRYAHYFKKVMFAIKKSDEHDKNLETFESVFQ